MVEYAGTGQVVVPGQSVGLVRDQFPVPRAQSVVLSAVFDDDGAIRSSVPFARLTWGCGGATHEADIDLKAGTVVSVIAQSSSVSVVYPPGTGPAVRVAASLAPGIVQHDSPTRTVFIGTLAPAAATARLRIPAYAASVLVYRTDADTQLSIVRFFRDSNAGSGPTKLVSAGPGAYAVWPIALSNDDMFINVTNNGLINTDVSIIAILGL